MLAAAVLLIGSGTAIAATARVAVATNFAVPLKQLQAEFERAEGHRLLVSPGSTGTLYAQIVHGAPFDLFLAADTARPQRLVRARLAAEPQFVYARGRLMLWSAENGKTPEELQELLAEPDGRLAIANEQLAPYGVAAVEALTALGLWQSYAPRVLRGQNVGQAYALAGRRNAGLALVAASLPRLRPGGSHWLLPATLHQPILQGAVLLQRGADNPAAQALVRYLQSPAVQTRLETWGYAAAADGSP